MSNYFSSSPFPHELSWPKWKYHATEDPKLVHNPAEEAELGEGWSDKYVYRAFPKAKYKAIHDPAPGQPQYEVVSVDTPEAEGKLGPGWSDAPPSAEKKPADEKHNKK